MVEGREFAGRASLVAEERRPLDTKRLREALRRVRNAEGLG
jgi:hypothetical protein